MTEEKRYTEAESHQKFAAELNGKAWELLGKPGRTADDNEMMVWAAFASLYHWSQIGQAVNIQRGEWLVSHCYAVLGRAEPALYHAKRCLELTDSLKLTGFDLGYSHEGMARALAASGKMDEAKKWFAKARDVGANIDGDEDKKLFMSDLEAEPWYGILQ